MILHRDKSLYSGQILGVILVLMAVGVLISVGAVTRTLTDQRTIVEEDRSQDAVEISDTVLDSVRDIELADFSNVLSSSSPGGIASVCEEGTDPSYEFREEGVCTINSFRDYDTLISTLSDNDAAGYDLEEYYNSAVGSYTEQCGDSSGVNSFQMIISIVDQEEVIEIEKDDVFGVNVTNVDNSACSLVVTPEPFVGNNGIIINNVYGTRDVNGEITGIDNVQNDDITGYNTGGGNGWIRISNLGGQVNINSTRVSTPVSSTLLTSRITAHGDNAFIRISTNPDQCMDIGDLLKVRSSINCAGNVRAKEYIITDEQWAPSVFDYSLFNSEGTIDNE